MATSVRTVFQLEFLLQHKLWRLEAKCIVPDEIQMPRQYDQIAPGLGKSQSTEILMIVSLGIYLMGFANSVAHKSSMCDDVSKPSKQLHLSSFRHAG